MHLYAIREPEMDAAFHLHPEPVADRRLPDDAARDAAGRRITLYGDIVHRNGFPETLLRR